MYMLNMVIILIVMYCNVVTAIDKIPTYLLRFNITVPLPGVYVFRGPIYSELLIPAAICKLILSIYRPLAANWLNLVRRAHPYLILILILILTMSSLLYVCLYCLVSFTYTYQDSYSVIVLQPRRHIRATVATVSTKGWHKRADKCHLNHDCQLFGTLLSWDIGTEKMTSPPCR